MLAEAAGDKPGLRICKGHQCTVLIHDAVAEIQDGPVDNVTVLIVAIGRDEAAAEERPGLGLVLTASAIEKTSTCFGDCQAGRPKAKVSSLGLHAC